MTVAQAPLLSVSVDSLGRCEHDDCNRVFCIEGVNGDAMDAPWHCPNCGKAITFKSFGFERDGLGCWQRVRWVSRIGYWINKRPLHPFKLRTFWVTVDDR